MCPGRSISTPLLVLLSVQYTAAQKAPPNLAELPPSADEVARSTGVLPLFQRLQEIARHPAAARNALEPFLIRQEIIEDVEGSSLQVDATLALLDNEIAQARELRGYLEDKRNRSVNVINLSGIAAGGALGVVSSALQLSSHLAKAGNATGIVSGTED